MAWYFRAVELADGGWACRHGPREFDIHAEPEAAIHHVTDLARECAPAEVLVHRLDGTVNRLGPVHD
jgi:hypothetical protein